MIIKRRKTITRSRYTQRGPWQHGRSKFELYVDTVSDGERKQRPVRSAEIDDLNELYTNGNISIEEGRQRLISIKNEIIAKQEASSADVIHPLNAQLANKYIAKKISIKVELVAESRDSEENTVWRCMKMLKDIPLATATTNQIQKILNDQETGGAHLHSLRVYRNLLRFIGRFEDAEALKKKFYEVKEPPFLTREQMLKLCESIPSDKLDAFPLMPDLIKIVWNTGVRIGEALALEAKDVKKQIDPTTKQATRVILVERQLIQKRSKEDQRTVHQRIRQPKGKRARIVVPLFEDEFFESFKKWLVAYPETPEREAYRSVISKTISTLSKKLFGIDAERGPSDLDDFFAEENLQEVDGDRIYKGVHMLRAGHAVYIIDTTGNDVFAANQIGDNIEVMRKHYSGRINKAKSVIQMANTLKQIADAKRH